MTDEPESAVPAATPRQCGESSGSSSSGVGIARGNARQLELRRGRLRRRRHLTGETAEGSSLLEQMAVSAPSLGDPSLVLDSGWLACVHPFWDLPAERAASRPVWSFIYPHYCRMFRMRLGDREMVAPSVPCHLRHSGASSDVSRGWQRLDKVQRRGQWRTTASVARYEKHPRLAGASHMLRPGQKALFLVCGAQLEAILHQRPDGAAVGRLVRG